MSFFKKSAGAKREQSASATTYNHGALIMGPPTFALLAVHLNNAAIAVTADSVPDSQFMPNISDTTADGTQVSELDPARYPEWTLRPYRYALQKGRASDFTKELCATSYLAIARIRMIHRVIFELNRYRSKIETGLKLQETVYLTKKLQAEEFKRSGYDESLLIKVPYVLQYADLESLSSREAADNILFRASLDDAFLAKTETLRMKYFDLTKRTTKLDDFPALLSQFLAECNFKQLV